jgi:hypothetical protein
VAWVLIAGSYAGKLSSFLTLWNPSFIYPDIQKIQDFKVTAEPGKLSQHTRVYPKVSGLSHSEIKTTINTRWEATQRVKTAKLTRLTHKVAIQLHLMAKSCTICSPRSRRPVRKLLDTPS